MQIVFTGSSAGFYSLMEQNLNRPYVEKDRSILKPLQVFSRSAEEHIERLREVL